MRSTSSRGVYAIWRVVRIIVEVAADLRNVIVFTVAGERLATELRWIREVISLGFVTAVPTAPPGIAGAFNLRGHLVPVLDVAALRGGAVGPQPRQGDAALLVEVDGVAAALRVDKVEEVATLALGPSAVVVDGRGRATPLVEPAVLVRRAIADANAARGDDGSHDDLSFERGTPRDPTTGARLVASLDGDVTLG